MQVAHGSLIVQLRLCHGYDRSWQVTHISRASCHAGSLDHDPILSSLSVSAGGAWEHDVPVQHGLCHGMAKAFAPQCAVRRGSVTYSGQAPPAKV